MKPASSAVDSLEEHFLGGGFALFALGRQKGSEDAAPMLRLASLNKI